MKAAVEKKQELFEQISAANSQFALYQLSSPQFTPYGRVIEGMDVGELLEGARRYFSEASATHYTASDDRLEGFPVIRRIQRELFGEFPIQAGCCWGKNVKLNGMEYHNSSEIICAATDMVLMLGKLQDVAKDGWDSSKAELFFVPEGSVLELYATTLHLAPCRVTESDFIAIIILPKGTNTPLEAGPEGKLWMKNKWMLAHAEGPAAAKGAAVLVTGKNLELKPVTEA